MELLEGLLQQVAIFTGDFSPKLIILLFFLLAIGEFGISIPYLLETVWLLSGYHFSTGTISVFQLGLLWLTAQAGRQAGALTLHFLSRFGSLPLMKLYQKHSSSNVPAGVAESNLPPFKFFQRLNLLSPLSVALGRLFWLRIPLTLTLGMQKRLKVLSLGVLISSLIWDGIYIIAGEAVGAHVVIRPTRMIFYSLLGITAFYIVIFIIKRLLRRRTLTREKMS